MPSKTYDWEALKKAFVTGENELNTFSREYNGLLTSPSYQSLKNKASQENWHEQRKAYRSMLSTVGTIATTSNARNTAQEIIKNTEALIDSAEAISRHIRIAKALQTDALALNQKLLPAIQKLNLENITPIQACNLLRALADVLTKATDIERKAMGLVDPTQQHHISIESNVKVEYEKLPDDELNELYYRKLQMN